MVKILYHVTLKEERLLLKNFLIYFIPPLVIIYAVMLIVNPHNSLKLITQNPWFFAVGLPSFTFALSFLLTWIQKSKGEDMPQDEFILYDNGWFVFWNITPDEGWIAPAKLDWILPPLKNRKELERKVGYKINFRYTLFDRYYLLKKKKNGKYKIGFGLMWVYPDKKWENWVFTASVGGWLTEKEYRKFLEMIEYIDKKAKENVESGRIKIPAHNLKQEHIAYYQMPWYWNEVFKKENIRELYKKETGEDIPEPVRSFLFDYETFKNVYLKNKRETGDWFGRSEEKD